MPSCARSVNQPSGIPTSHSSYSPGGRFAHTMSPSASVDCSSPSSVNVHELSSGSGCSPSVLSTVTVPSWLFVNVHVIASPGSTSSVAVRPATSSSPSGEHSIDASVQPSSSSSVTS